MTCFTFCVAFLTALSGQSSVGFQARNSFHNQTRRRGVIEESIIAAISGHQGSRKYRTNSGMPVFDSSGQYFEAYDKVNDLNVLPDDVVKSLDVVVVLGGGVPTSLAEPPRHVQRRCDVAAAIVDKYQALDGESDGLPILTISAGTAHLPQLLSSDGLPVWESTSSAAYLRKQHGIENIFVETASYDTISNAFFSRTTHTEIVGWRSLAIVTSEFHIARTKSIFDWIFNLDEPERPYQLHYVACDNAGLSKQAIKTREEHEARGDLNVRENLARQYTSMSDVWRFLHHKHAFYTASKLIERAEKKERAPGDMKLKESYGSPITDTNFVKDNV